MAGGGTLRDHLEQVALQTGNLPVQLRNTPDLWPAAEYLWKWFGDLHAARLNTFAPQPVSYHEIAAWRDLHKIDLRPPEVEALRMLDLAYLAWSAKQIEKRPAPFVSRNPIEISAA